MVPYYSDDRVTLYHGDALDVLANVALSDVAAVVTDPPYASGARTEASKSSSGAMMRGVRWNSKPITNDQMTTTGFVWLIRHVAAAIYPALAEGGSLLSFIDWRQWPNLVGALETVNLRVQGMVVWDKRSMGLGNGFRSQHELIAHACKGTPRITDRSVGNVIVCPREATSVHPSPKPVPLMEKLLGVVSAPGEVIVDPFMGAGATVVAALNTGRRVVGIEVEERYCEVAASRFEQGIFDLFGDAA